MDFSLWIAFVVTYGVISILPGPSVFMVTGVALTRGLRAAFVCILRDLVAGVVLIALSLFGVGMILATSAILFQAVKWAGVFYMAYLGVTQIISARSVPLKAELGTSVNDLANLKIGFLTGVLNPKAILFYMAFLSQFTDPTGDALLQFAILVPTATVVVGVVLAGYALLAERARRAFQSQAARRRFGYAGGGVLLGGSVLMATTR